MPRSRTRARFVHCATVLAAVAATALAALATGPAAAAPVPAHNPLGAVNSFTLNGAVASYTGWAADPDMSGRVRVVVTLDSTVVSSTLANRAWPGVATAYASLGANRGFAGSLTLPAGRRTVCLTIGDLGTGSDTRLACKVFTAPTAGSAPAVKASKKPIGIFESFTYSAASRTISVRGWALDPDTRGPIYVDMMIDGQSLGSAVAGGSRPDIGTKYPLSGANHGFAYAMQAVIGSGNHQLCAVAINATAGGNTILYYCKLLTIPPVADPAVLNVALTATAAATIQAQAISSGAAKAAIFPAGANSATRIALATRALLQQAMGRTTRPPAVTGIPAFAAASPSRVVDEQAVMGPRPSLGTFPALKTGGRTGLARSLQPFVNDPRPTPGGPGDGPAGAAPVLVANGKTVHPALPGYPAGYPRLRAEVAIDAALAHIGDRYVYAAAGPTTFDCSGLTQWSWAKAGVALAHYTGSQAVQGVRVQDNQLLPGDLVLFGNPVHHVGTYLGAGYMVDAPYTGAYVRVDKISGFKDFSLAVRP
jgi:cell wall-associated NlpC family hydrolase